MLAWSSINNHQLLGFALFGLIGVLVAYVIMAAVWARRRGLHRLKKLVQLAESLGLTFSPEGRPQIRNLPWSKEEGAHALNTFHGQFRNRRVLMGDYYYIERGVMLGGSRSSHSRGMPLDRYVSYCSLPDLDAGFPALTIRPESLWDKVSPVLRKEDIDFESQAFSSAFFVSCSNRKFASWTITPAMMEFCLHHRQYCIQLADNSLTITCGDVLWTPQQFNEALQFAVDWLALVPEICWSDYPKPFAAPEPPVEFEAVQEPLHPHFPGPPDDSGPLPRTRPPARPVAPPPSDVFLEPPS